jgi:hypothetical protein
VELKNSSRIYRDIASRAHERYMHYHPNPRLIKFIIISLLISCFLNLFVALDGCSYSFSLMRSYGDPDFCGSYSGSHISKLLATVLSNYLVAPIMFFPFLLSVGIFGSNVILWGLIFSYIWLRRSAAKDEGFPIFNFTLHILIFFICFFVAKIAILDPLLNHYLLS